MPRKRHHDNLGELPSHLTRRASTDSELWQRMERQFSESCDVVLNMRLESKDEATGELISPKRKNRPAKWAETAPRWFDPVVGADVRSWMLIPYIDGLDQDRLGELLSKARSLVLSLREHFAIRILSVQFLCQWGDFCSYAAAVQLVYFNEPSGGRIRNAAIGGEENLEKQKRWFSCYFIKTYKGRGDAVGARERMRRFILAILADDETYASPFGTEWFEKFLNLEGNAAVNKRYEQLTGTFREDLTIKEMQALASGRLDDLPPLTWNLPPS